MRLLNPTMPVRTALTISLKANGLIGLLSGPLGAGKTLTVEAVSEASERLLYYLSAGDLGIGPESLDNQFSSILELCQS